MLCLFYFYSNNNARDDRMDGGHAEGRRMEIDTDKDANSANSAAEDKEKIILCDALNLWIEEEDTDEDTKSANGVNESKEIVISDQSEDEADAAVELPDNR